MHCIRHVTTLVVGLATHPLPVGEYALTKAGSKQLLVVLDSFGSFGLCICYVPRHLGFE
jgi:hypothetical protein